MAKPIRNKSADIVLSCLEEKYYTGEILREHHTLVRIVSGEMKVVQAERAYTFSEGDTLLFPRNQLTSVIKYPANDRPYKSVALYLTSERLKAYYAEHEVTTFKAYDPQIRTFKKHPLLESIFSSLYPYFDLTDALPESIVAGKVTEVITILRTIDKDIDSILANFEEPGKIDLADFMERNYMFNMPMDKFGYLTGRSLTTFKRDFKKAFNTTPQKWLTKKRLELAHYELTEKHRRPVDVYFEAGFENLSHFSFAFKKYFGYAPSGVLQHHSLTTNDSHV